MLMPGPVVVMGAGAVGCYVGGMLAAAGLNVTFVGRPRVIDVLRDKGLTLSALDGATQTLLPRQLQLTERLAPIKPALVLLCVKSGATEAAAIELAAAVPAGTTVLSLQNGVSNAQLAAAAAPNLTLIAGMVPFNVAEVTPGHFHRGTSGELAAQDHAALRDWPAHFARAGVPLQLHAALRDLQWGKLLLNLNNPVNALSGMPLKAQLLNRSMRRVTAALQREALAVMRAAGVRPARLTPLPARLLPAVLTLPTWLFRLVAARMLRIDSRARSSMADDLALGRKTEIDALCGEVVRLAATTGAAAPLNARMCLLMNSVHRDKRKRSGSEMLAILGLPKR